MVCEKCEKKLTQVVTPEPWKSRAGVGSGVAPGKAGPLKRATPRFSPMNSKPETCRICRTKVHQVGSHYCQACAYKKGICAMCGKKLLDIKNYRQSST